jgi:pyroglutamyl-peptidase
MKVLITGFEPFHDHKINPSQLLVQNLPETHGDTRIVKAILPVHHIQAPEKLQMLLKTHQPNAVLAFGLAAGRTKVSLERVAINLMDFSIADNAGVTITNQLIDPNGPTAYFGTLPLEKLLTSIIEIGVPVEISLSAGAYLCNLVFYKLMQWVSLQNKTISAGFIHLPALPEQAANSNKSLPSLPLEYSIKAALNTIDTISQLT